MASHASVEALGRKLKLAVILHAAAEIAEKPKIASLWVYAEKKRYTLLIVLPYITLKRVH